MITKSDLFEKLLTSFLAILTPFIIHFFYPCLGTVSQSWNTPLQPMFIISNALVSFYFFKIPKWRVSAILLLLLTAFSVKDYFVLHNIFALTFFIFSGFALTNIHRFNYYFLLYLSSICVFPLGLYWVETWAIVSIALYHIHLSIYTYFLKK